MIVFKSKAEIMDFFKFVIKDLDKNLTDSGFEVNLSIIPLHSPNLKVVHDAFQAYGKSVEPKIVKPNDTIPNT